jgi:hypothetical protein
MYVYCIKFIHIYLIYFSFQIFSKSCNAAVLMDEPTLYIENVLREENCREYESIK